MLNYSRFGKSSARSDCPQFGLPHPTESGYCSGHANHAAQSARATRHRLPARSRHSHGWLGEQFRRRPRILAPVPLVRLRRRRPLLRDLGLHHRPYASRGIRPTAKTTQLPVPPLLARLSALLDRHGDRGATDVLGTQRMRLQRLGRLVDPHPGRVPQLLHPARLDAELRSDVLRGVRPPVTVAAPGRPVVALSLGHRHRCGADFENGQLVPRGDDRAVPRQSVDLGVPTRMRRRVRSADLPCPLRPARHPRRFALGGRLDDGLRGSGSAVCPVYHGARKVIGLRARCGAHRLRLHRGRAAGNSPIAEVVAIDGGRFVFNLPLARPGGHVSALQHSRLAAPHGPALGLARLHAARLLGRRDAPAPLGGTAADELDEARTEAGRTGDHPSPRAGAISRRRASRRTSHREPWESGGPRRVRMPARRGCRKRPPTACR